MTINEFYNRYNLNKYHFAYIAGVGTKSLIKFARGEILRASTKERIEKAMRVAEKYDLVKPRYDYARGIKSGISYKTEFHRKVCEYENRFKQLIEEEEETL